MIKLPPKARLALYTVGVLVFAVVSVLSLFKVIDPAVAANVSAQLVSVLGLFGITIAGTAAYNVSKQQQDGTFDQEPLSPADKIHTGLSEVLDQKAAADAAVETVKNIVIEKSRELPVLGPLAEQILSQLTK